ncbi:MAG TPA: M56 family metallopeptidase [Terriglobales bacterium]
MISDLFLNNLFSWMAQTLVIGSLGALLPLVFRIRHARTQLYYCHCVILLCLALPLIQPRRHEGTNETAIFSSANRPNALSAIAISGPPITATKMTSDSGATHDSFALPLRSHEGLIRRLPAKQTAFWALIAGFLIRVLWLLGGLWQIKRFRISSTPLYPVPEPVKAAAALTNADALFCISSHVLGPVMFGFLNPLVLLPQMFLDLNDEAQCTVACHELLHVRRHDWAVTLLEEVMSAAFWFNPGIWALLAQARLAREELVDAEVVRLTVSREPYIDAILAIARVRPNLDLAPAPLLLRRRHLTQRMHALLKEVSMSRLRLSASYISTTAILTLTAWFAMLWFPLLGQSQISRFGMSPEAQVSAAQPRMRAQGAPVPPGSLVAPVPQDPHEPVSTDVTTAATPRDRANLLSLLERAKQNADLHMPGTAPFSLAVTFVAGGDVTYVGSGELTETWLSGQSWRWTASLGNYSQVRIGSGMRGFDEQQVRVIPMRVKMLRQAIFWPIGGNTSTVMLRKAAVEWNGKPTTCILMGRPYSASASSRDWTETEYCIDNGSGLLQVYSEVPGTYAVYGYNRSLQFHGRLIPDELVIYVAGSKVVEAQINIADAGAVDPALLTITPQMRANGPGVALVSTQFPMEVQSASITDTIKPVVVHATISSAGTVLEEELSSAADPTLAQAALDTVKKTTFAPMPWAERDAYIQVRFVRP